MLAMENPEREAERGFDTGDAVGRALEFNLFFVARVRGVVGGDAVDSAIHERSQNSLPGSAETDVAETDVAVRA